MPELPEVQALVQVLATHTTGRLVRAVHVTSFPSLKTYDPPPAALVGGTVTGVHRHGKWLDVSTEGDDGELHLVVHLARAGWVRWHDIAPTGLPRAGRSGLAARVVLDDGAFDLTEAGTKKSLAIHVVRQAVDVERIASLGVEPLSAAFTRDLLDELLDGKNQQIKGLLRDQGVIAGIGNAYSDEILHAARLSPFTLTRSLDADARDRLFRSIGTVLDAAIRAATGKEAAELKDVKRSHMAVHGRAGQPCPVCGDVVAEVSFADSSLQYCPTCQTGGKRLADRRMSKLLR
ncbi:Fpg/Nei family DNA glycosylase [Georgenia sp. H159]|uniref:Fpg/Nei family DNA glycosylase n=1 Tax=Georgenia sp. H159 TaxID=3076115 RepID=UPI002D798409|nr:DNA-formamidopyrimidine glycosylase family protein [Georgenia sp. H159]